MDYIITFSHPLHIVLYPIPYRNKVVKYKHS